MVTKNEILESLISVKDPLTGSDIVSCGYVKDVQISGDKVSLSIEAQNADGSYTDPLKDAVRKAALAVRGVKNVSISMTAKSPAAKAAAESQERAASGERRILSARFVVPVASGKGGVGKSTVSANIAVALAKLGHRVGLMDADVYGPSIPTLLGVQDQPDVKGSKIIPPERLGVKIISMGFFLPKGEAVVWRGPMLAKTIDQFLGSVEWGDLDYLIVDLPPGTGDIQLSLCQKIPLSGAVIVSTPQDLAFAVAEKAIAMFRKLKTPILGLVENMSGYECRKCGHREEIFGSGGARRYSEEKQIPFLGEIPLATDIRTTSDRGMPIVESDSNSASARAFMKVAENLELALVQQSKGDRVGEGAVPEQISQPSKSEFRIRWMDGHDSPYSSFQLRTACPCAMCVDEMTGHRALRPDTVKKDVYPVSWERVGRYAVSFRWSDGHATGIYSFDYLRKLCKCASCLNAKVTVTFPRL